MTDDEILNVIRSGGDEARSPINAWLLLGISLIAFAGLGAFRWDVTFVILIVIAIFVHELGHLLAMKLYKYKNLKMLFLPFIGAAASGQSDEQDSFKIAMISIFGPVVGILSCYAAVAGWLVARQDILVSYAYLSLFLNVFNLLPIVPLDGGHFLNETLFSRFPKAELVFKIVAIVALCLLAYTLQVWVFWVIAGVMLVTLSVSYKMARAARTLRKDADLAGGELTEVKVARMRSEIRKANPYFESDRNIRRLPKVIKDMWVRVNKRFPKVRTTVFLVLAYVVVLLGLSTFTGGFIYGATGQAPGQRIEQEG